MDECPTCQGGGKVPVIYDGYYERMETCDDCGGSGEVEEDVNPDEHEHRHPGSSSST